MSNFPQFSKFSPVTLTTKRNLRQLRLNAGHTMNKGAHLLGISRKQLEDLETDRNYGCHIDLEILAKLAIIYGTTTTKIIGVLPDDYNSEYFIRPRQRKGSKPRK